MLAPLHCAITATGTEVGKTWVTTLLTIGLRQRGRAVWLWKPVACGDWDGKQAGDPRALSQLIGDGQNPATLCQHQWPEPASPHRAAAAAGDSIPFDTLVREGEELLRTTNDVIIEGAGGLLSPLSSELHHLGDLAAHLTLPLIIVTRPDLGTFHHTAAVVEAARSRDLPILGLVVNQPQPVQVDVATQMVAEELSQWLSVPLLADLPHGAESEALASGLAEQVCARHADWTGS